MLYLTTHFPLEKTVETWSFCAAYAGESRQAASQPCAAWRFWCLVLCGDKEQTVAKSMVQSTHQLHSRICESVARLGVSALYQKTRIFDKRFGTVLCIAASQPRLNWFTWHHVCITHLQETGLSHRWKWCKLKIPSYGEKMFHYEAELEEAMLTVVQHSPLPPYFTTIH